MKKLKYSQWHASQKKQLTEHPTASIGCVIPHLENIRDRVIQIFSTVFCEKNTYSLEHNHLPFNISAGKSLTHYPIIHAAFDCLSFQKEKISLEEFSRFLRSPFIGNAEQEYLQRAQFDSRLRHANKTSFSFLQLLDHDSPIHIGKYCPLLKKRLHVLTHYVENLTSLLPTNEWVTHFMTILDILGWPGERSLNSHEYQIVQRWLNVLVEYRSFDNIFPPLSFKDTIQALNRLATKTIFQPQSHEAPIQILGMLEAAELPFDYTWVMGLDDTRWPPAAKPNPFITQRLQKTLHMPHATAERELTYSKALTEQLKNSAKHIIFSHAGQSGEGELRPSFLISHLPQIQLETLELDECISPAERIYQSRKLETIQDEKAPSISQNEKINGGISIFKQQAACPFKAFAEIRLNARPLESPTLGLNPAERGTLTHKALELLWRQLENSTQLAKLDEFDLKNLLDQTVTEAMQFIIDEAPTARYFSLEKERLKTLLWDWVQLEKARPPFKVISKEEETTLTISNMMITVRVDRIDELEDGSHLIIDYKTGKNHHIKYWFSDRPDEPQLPLYCMTNPKNTIGIAFATIHPNNMELLGVSKKDLSLQNIKLIADIQYAAHPDWEQQILSWQTTLEKIGTAFYQGDARVDPKENDQTCRYCELQSLCRIHEEDEYDSHS